MTLFEIDAAIRACVIDGDRAVDTETGEIIDHAALAALEMARDKKIENIAMWHKELLAEAAALKAEADKLMARRKTAENKAESLKSYLDEVLGGEKFKTARVAISYRKSEPVEITNQAKIPQEFLRVKTEPDKTAIKAALKAGKEVDGARLVESRNIQIK